MTNIWQTWKLCSKASSSMGSDSKDPSVGSLISGIPGPCCQQAIQTSKSKIEAILKVKTPTNQTELKSFLGMANQYGKFIPCLADLSSPLNQPVEEGCSVELVRRTPGEF